MKELIEENPCCDIPALTMPIDFSRPVSFVVIGGQDNVGWYTVTVAEDSGAAQVRAFGFSKFDNPELTKDAVGVINETNKTIDLTAYFPVEYHPGGKLIPSFDLVGNSLLDGVTALASETSAMTFIEIWDSPQIRTLKAQRAGYTDVEYTLAVTFTRDPDTVRSITDFRFGKEDNSGLAMTSLGVCRA